MQRLPAEVRRKAIEIANAMLAEGCEEGQAIRMAIAAARKWAWAQRAGRSTERRDADAPPQRTKSAANAPGKG